MKRVAFVCGALAVVLATPAWAGPKDKISETLVNPTSIAGGAGWDNKTISTKVKSGKCKMQIQAKGAGAPLFNEPVVCLAEADVLSASLPGGGPAGNSVVVAGSFDDKGKLKIKGGMAAIGCGVLSEALALNGTTTCYLQDIGTYDWKTACSNAGMLPIDPNILPGTEGEKAGAVVGLCQGVVQNGGQRIDPPGGTLLVVHGSYQPLL